MRSQTKEYCCLQITTKGQWKTVTFVKKYYYTMREKKVSWTPHFCKMIKACTTKINDVIMKKKKHYFLGLWINDKNKKAKNNQGTAIRRILYGTLHKFVCIQKAQHKWCLNRRKIQFWKNYEPEICFRQLQPNKQHSIFCTMTVRLHSALNIHTSWDVLSEVSTHFI